MGIGEPIAHIAENGRVHPLREHLQETARRAAEFAAEFGCTEWGRLAGLWHDLGKFSPEFQRYIRAVAGVDANIEAKPGKVNHSTAGGLLALQRLGKMGRVIAYLATGHHAGLPDWRSEITPLASLEQRLAQIEHLQAALSGHIPADILNNAQPVDRPKPGTDLALSLWVRMLFSCLVDADFLDTEKFFEPDKADLRDGYPNLPELLLLFDGYMNEKQAQAADTQVNRIRAEVLESCRSAASQPPGIFTLTVPTGGGKTLSSMAFALNHAVKHEKRRIIYVIPYTSIIEQTADQFRKIFGEAVIEHHSNLDVADEAKETARNRLACENWDAPVIVTTSVQFFESLFASRTSRCRKLHNIINSVVVLDEAQLLPPDFLKPALETMKELQRNYGVTFVLSTATQPALGPHRSFDFSFDGIPDMKEIVPDPQALHFQLKRTEIGAVGGLGEPLSWDLLAKRLMAHESVLCIVNRRDDARTLWERMPSETFHLSALMCGAHRSERIGGIRRCLQEGKPIRVVSTQLVEAGVDLDFPVVYRALAGLDSIAQAAGRCNREGLLDKGKVFVFMPESAIPVGHLRQAAEIGQRLLENGTADPLSPEQFGQFFREFYWMRGDKLDKEKILDLLRNDAELRLSFRTSAGRFRLIDENAHAPVVVRYREGSDLIDLLRRQGPERWLMRRLQRYVVNLPRRTHNALLSAGAIQEVHPGIFVQGHETLYDEELGLCPDKSLVYEPDDLII